MHRRGQPASSTTDLPLHVLLHLVFSLSAMPTTTAVLEPLLGTLAGIVGIYATFIALLTIPTLQDHVIYLHRVTLTWFQDVNVPE